jgi:hypothetical protein
LQDISASRELADVGAKNAHCGCITASGLQKKLAGRLRNFRRLTAIATSFFVGVISVSANLSQNSPEVNGSQDRIMLSWENSVWPSAATAPLNSNETVSIGYFYDESVSSVLNSSNTAFASMLASSYTNIRLQDHQNVTLSGAPGETVTLNLRNFALHNHATLTLVGTATTSFVINVTKQFSLSGMSKIILSGGIQWNNVFFNVLGSGSTVSLSGKASLTGTLTAAQRVVRLRGQTVVYGKVIAPKVLLSNAAQIVLPPVTSP